MPEAPRTMKAMTLKSVAFGAITSSYANFGSALANSLQIVTFKNTTDQTIFISEDGTNDHYELPPNSADTVDCQANARSGDQAVKKTGLQFKIKGVSGSLPTSGKVIMQGQYLL